jgi:hypothetical protein
MHYGEISTIFLFRLLSLPLETLVKVLLSYLYRIYGESTVFFRIIGKGNRRVFQTSRHRQENSNKTCTPLDTSGYRDGGTVWEYHHDVETQHKIL